MYLQTNIKTEVAQHNLLRTNKIHKTAHTQGITYVFHTHTHTLPEQGPPWVFLR